MFSSQLSQLLAERPRNAEPAQSVANKPSSVFLFCFEFTFPHRDRVSVREQKLSEPVGRRKFGRRSADRRTEDGHRLPGDPILGSVSRQRTLRRTAVLQVIVVLRALGGMGNSSSDRSSGGQGGERSYRDGPAGGKEARGNILMDTGEDGDVFQREDAKVRRLQQTGSGELQVFAADASTLAC